MHDLINQFIQWIIPAIEQFRDGGYWIAFFAAFLETLLGIGLILPGSTILLLLGALAAKGYLDVSYVIFFAIIGATLGDNLNYFLGKHFGDRWLKRDYWFLKADHLEKSRAFLNRHGAKSVFLGRFVPTVKELMPFIAGSVRMSHGKFMLWNVLGAIGWGFQFVLPGYLFAQSISLAQLWLSRIGLFILALILLIFLLYWLKFIVIRKGPVWLGVLLSLGHSIRTAILDNPHVQQWQASHPSASTFIARRLNREQFTGLPLTLLVLSLSYVIALFGGITEDLLNSDIITSIDIRLADLLMAYRVDELTTFFTWVTRLGNTPVVLAFSIIALLFFWLTQRRHWMIPMLTSIAGSTAFTFLGKFAFHRARPDTAIFLEKSHSFPSGHATIAVALYGFWGWVWIREAKTLSSQVNRALVTLCLISLIGLSRLYLGEHYLSDVWAGYLVGAMWLIFAIILVRLAESNRFHNVNRFYSASEPISLSPAIKSILIFSAVTFYLIFAWQYKQPLVPQPVKALSELSQPDAVLASSSDHYTLTVLGTQQEPINLIFTAPSYEAITESLQQSGWQPAANSSNESLSTQLSRLMSGADRGSLPLSPSFWKNRVQDAGWVYSLEKHSYSHSLHLKLWQTNAQLPDGQRIFVGMTNAVDGVSWKLFPKIDPNLDLARKNTVTSLNPLLVKPANCIKSINPESGHNFVGDPFFTDGKLCILSLPDVPHSIGR